MLNKAVLDCAEAIKGFPLALHFALSDTKVRYRRSFLGPVWLVLTTAIGVAGLGLLWSVLFKVDKAVLVPSLTVGLVVWQLISGCIVESPMVFVRQANVIRNIRTSYLIFPIQLLLRQFINFIHNLVVVVAVLAIFPPQLFGFQQLLFIPGLVLLLGNLLWVITLIGLLGARFRDIEQLVVAVMPVLFFLSPVIYRPDQLGVNKLIVWVNPVAYLISLVRDPIQGVVPHYYVYIGSIGFFIAGWAVTLWALNRKYGRIAFWM